MGCATSKSKQKRCRNCSAPYSPVTRSYSLHAHHPSLIQGDSYQVVALSSTTIGSISYGDHDHYHDHVVVEDEENDEVIENNKVEFEVGMIEAKSWSKMIDEKITKVVPKTPIRTPPGEPESINAWEMMEGLEDTSPLIRSVDHHVRSFSFHVFPNEMPDLMESSPPNTSPSPKPFWMDTPDCVSNEKALSKTVVSEFDPEIISAFRKALEELSPTNPFRLSKLQRKTQNPGFESNGIVDDVKVAIGLPEEKVIGVMETEEKTEEWVKERLVLYFTSLRGVRKTYEECCNVRMILKSLGVRVDERDVSMHCGFKEELKELLGESYGGGLPRVFVGDNYIGGAEEIRRMHEEGKLEKVLERCEFVEGDGNGSFGGSCEACGDVRFVPCETCSGSCKIYYEVDEEEEEEEEEDEEGEFGFQRCPNCNENGLIRCPICCYY